MIVFSAAHQSSKGLSVPNEKSARHIDMKIILWIFYRFFQIHRRRSRIGMPKPYGVIMDFSRTHRGRCPIDMTPSLSDWYDKNPLVSRWWMTHSFRYDWWPVILIRFTDSFWIHYGDISLSYRDETTQISYGLFFRLMMGKAHIDMTQGCRIDMIGCSLSYRDDSYWNDVRSRIDMSLTLVLIWPPLSYRYVEGKEDFVPSVISQSESHISYHFDWKDWRSLTSFFRSFS